MQVAGSSAPRRSARFAARLENKKATVALDDTDTGQRPAFGNKKKPRPKAHSRGKTAKPPPALPHNAQQSKEQPVKSGKRKTRPTPLTHAALKQLEKETQGTALPQTPNMYKPTDPRIAGMTTEDVTTATTKTTKYNVEALYQLAVRGVLPQQSPSERPNNYDEIRRVIEQPRSRSPPLKEEEYHLYWESVFDSENEQAIAKAPCDLLFGMQFPFSRAHSIQYGQQWLKHVPIQGSAEPLNVFKFTKAPKPDGAEGLKIHRVPGWIVNDLDALITPGSLAFPNFMLEMKRDGSMYTAYAENTHAGSIATQAFHEYYAQIRQTPEESWDIARVGSIQFNGSIVEGNIHWVSKKGGDGKKPQDREYHMTRVMHNSTTGLGIEDFEKARREARNFRDYFCSVREELLEDFPNHADRPPHRPAPVMPSIRNSKSTRAASSMPSEASTRVSRQRAVAKKALAGGTKRGRGRPRKNATVEHAGVRKARGAKP
ncbi:hypothetical protein MMC30_009024 [Trapelia coarctata]|nr:hypothetical protein [Trapelia coarctata]